MTAARLCTACLPSRILKKMHLWFAYATSKLSNHAACHPLPTAAMP